MTAPAPGAPWHKESYDRFLNERLPELLAARLSLDAYRVEPAGTYACNLSMTLNGTTVEIVGVACPDEHGVFEVEGVRRVVVPLASREELDQAEIRCVGEQLADFIEPRLNGGAETRLGEWTAEFLKAEGQTLADENGLSRLEHTRAIVIDVPRGDQKIGVPGQLGRTCPIMTPEGPNVGKVLFLARGATIRDGRLIATDGPPADNLSVGASCIPLLHHDDTNRALMGANMMRQWIVPPEPEPALVQTGLEPDVPESWCGRNLLTAYVPWGVATFEDGIVVSESGAKRLSFGAPLEPGDKVSNRHGTKGVISRILPDDEMPHLANGTPAEIVYSFMGIPSRMNFGQVREAVLGRIAKVTGEPILAPPFGGPSNGELRELLAAAGLPENGMEVLRMGKAGPPLDRPSTVGVVYWGLTHHLVRGKLRWWGWGGSFHGQRRGEMEYWALRDAGAVENITEAFNTCSCERDGVDTLAGEIANRTFEPSPPPTPMFRHLRRRLAAGGIRMDFDGERVTFALTPPEGETLELACPVPHPWLDDAQVTAVGTLPGEPEFERLVAANEGARRVLDGNVPETLAARARGNVAGRVAEFFESLRRPEGSDLKGRIVAGGRVAFSGRSVITPGIDLHHDQVGVPDEMAWDLFGPFVARELGNTEAVAGRTDAAAKKLDELMAASWVIVNRAPTLHEACHIAFHPVRIPGRALRLHSLACMSLNADFDGDQIAVFLPVTPEAQKEAGEKLSLVAHLKRDPKLLRWMCPSLGALWGLAALGQSAEGRRELAELAGRDVAAEAGIVTKAGVVAAARAVFERDGAEAALDLSERLMWRGFEAAKRSGGSICVFAAEDLSAPPPFDPLTLESWTQCLDGLKDAAAARREYGSAELGAQLLALHCGARGNLLQFVVGLTCRTVVDERGDLVYIPRGMIDGLEPEQYFACTVGARRGLGQTALNVVKWGLERRDACVPRGLSVLARGMAAKNAGPILARAAANGEVDPLTDPDARLFVGLTPL